MSTKKHLVLDDDVHEALEQRKGLTGSSIKDIGNDVLRSSLESVFLGDIIGRILVESGKVSENEYGQALEQAFTKIKTTPNLPVERTLKGTLVAGSWESRQLFQRSDGSFQILESWTRDSRKLPMQAHQHAAEEFFVVLAGRIIVTMSGTPYTLRPLSMLQVPGGVIHSVEPLDDDCHLLSVLLPAVQEYFQPNNGIE
jgi:mannose-6-phosphate isomerase-like protein (cupin superfamily)